MWNYGVILSNDDGDSQTIRWNQISSWSDDLESIFRTVVGLEGLVGEDFMRHTFVLSKYQKYILLHIMIGNKMLFFSKFAIDYTDWVSKCSHFYTFYPHNLPISIL